MVWLAAVAVLYFVLCIAKAVYPIHQTGITIYAMFKYPTPSKGLY